MKGARERHAGGERKRPPVPGSVRGTKSWAKATEKKSLTGHDRIRDSSRNLRPPRWLLSPSNWAMKCFY